mgnify:CR=1 FL=1
MCKHRSSVIREYIKGIKNEDILDSQESIYSRYINIEDIKTVTKEKNKNKDYRILQEQSEYNRKNYFITKKKIIDTSSVYFSPQFENFTTIIVDYMELPTTKQSVKVVFLNFQIAIPDNLSGLFVHLICSILSKVDDITLTNCRIQMRNLLEKNYLLFLAKNKSSRKTSVKKFTDVRLKKSGWYQLSDLIISGLKESRIVDICKKLGARKRKHKVDYISIARSFRSIALAYDYKASNMPLISKPENWEILGDYEEIQGGFLVHKKALIMYNKEKSLMTRVNQEILSNINFLQEVPYKINKKRLKEILANFNQYLKKQDLRIHLYKNKQDFLEEEYKYNHTYQIYNKQLRKVQQILETLEQALYLINFPCFYFTLYLDFRTRIYYHGWPINPQGSSLARELIMFSNQRIKSVTKELDVSASGLQIIGGLLRNFDYLENTNLLIKKNQLSKKKYDIYSETLNKYLLQKEFKDKNHKKFIKSFFNRKVFKSIIMCYFYNETHFGVVKKLEALGSEFGQGFKINEEVTLIRNFLKKEFEEYQILSLLINYGVNSSIKNQKAISLYKGNVETFQYYALQEVIQVDYYDRYGKRQKIRVCTDKDPLSLDTRKTRRATLPNFIHNLDSQLLHSVILKAQKHNIYLAVIHDCFIVHKKHEFKLKKWYFEAFNDLILSRNNSVLFTFLDRNLSEIEYKNFKKDFLEILKKDFIEIYKKKNFSDIFKKKDFSKISIKDYKMSPYILS